MRGGAAVQVSESIESTPSSVDRDVFTNGWYAQQFRPDDARDPFRALYDAKRRDVLASIGRADGERAVLDLGGGMGRIAVPLATHHRVTLCDISTDMLDMAREAADVAGIPEGRLIVREVDASKPLPFATGAFDHAVALDLLVHLADPVASLRELRRVLDRDGQLIVDCTNRSGWWLLRYPRYIGPHPRRWVRTWRGGGVLPEWQSIVRHYTHAEFREMLDVAGFHVAEERRYGPAGSPKWFLSICRPLARSR